VHKYPDYKLWFFIHEISFQFKTAAIGGVKTAAIAMAAVLRAVLFLILFFGIFAAASAGFIALADGVGLNILAAAAFVVIVDNAAAVVAFFFFLKEIEHGIYGPRNGGGGKNRSPEYS
jgi:hypothetical protein